MIGRRSVLLVVTDTRRGGAPLRLASLAKGMQERGWRCHLVSLMPAGAVLGEVAAAGIPTTNLNVTGWRSAISGFFTLRKIINQHKPAIVQSALWHANLFARFAALGTGAVVVSGHESVDPHKPLLRTLLDRATGAAAHGHTAVAEAVATEVAHRDGVPRERIAVIPLGKDPTTYLGKDKATARNALGLAIDPPTVGWVGRMHPVKRLPLLLQAVSLLPRWQLVIAGDGPERNNVQQVALDLGIHDRVKFLGELPDVTDALMAMDVFCLVSEWEGLPTAMLEAMAAGLPVIATSVGGIPEVIDDGVNGLLIAEPRAESVARGIEQALSLPGLGSRARATIEERFSERAVLDSHEALWTRLLREHLVS